MARPLIAMTLTAGLLAAPTMAFAQADGTPGNPPGSAASRALDSVTGQPSIPDGAPGNPPGTAVGRALDRAAGTPTHPDGSGNNPPGTALDRAAERAAGLPAAAATATAQDTAIVRERPRMSQILGANVYNEQGEKVGEIEDVVMHGAGTGPVAVIQVGGFLGIGGRLVAVPLADLRWHAERERVMLPAATKEDLRQRPAFEFASLGRR